MDKTLYFNIEDDVTKISARLKREPGKKFTLVLPQRSYVFADPINLKLLKKQVDLLKKEVDILTLDERGQAFAKDAGFELKARSRGSKRGSGMGDIVVQPSSADPGEAFIEKEIKVKSTKKPTTKSKIKVATSPAIKKHDIVFSPAAKSVFASAEEPMFDKPPRSKGGRKFGLVFSIILLLALVAGAWLYLPTATVTVSARTEAITRTVAMTLLPGAESGEADRLLLPTQKITRQLEVSDKFTTQGKEELGAKARGEVKIVNLTGGTLNLRSSTTVLSSESGQQYKFVTDQTQIKPLTAANVAANPDVGHTAEVEAVTPGEGSNITKGERLEISNQVFGKKPEQLYARVSDEVTGGNSRFVSVITQQDFDEAQKELTAQAVEQVRSSLELDGLVVPEGGWQSSVVEFSPEKPVGTQTPTFVARVKVDLNLVAFKESGVREVLRRRLEQTLSPNLVLQASELDTVEYKVPALDFASTRLDASAAYTSKASHRVDTEDLAQQLKGKSKVEAGEIILNDDAVSKVEIKLEPGWVPSLPWISQRINIRLSQ